jgi:multiple sugar transport system substrate-binding protein
LPAMDGGKSATCLGGWQWAVSAFSKKKDAAARLVQYLATPESSRFLAREGGLLPTRLPLYSDPEVLRQSPWMADAARIVAAAHARPRTAQYGQISDVIRTNTSAILARSKTPQEGVESIDFRLRRVLR